MRKVNLLAVCATAFASMLVFASCSQPEPAAEPSLDDEAAVTRATSLDNFARVAYVEVNDVNPLNAGEYTLSNSRYVTKASKSSWVTSATIPGPDSPT